VEGFHRLLGLYFLRLDELDPATKGPAEARKAALGHFLISHHLAEVLRERIPPDHIGLNQAGFFARRAYVNDKIIELLADDQPAEALHYAELASARSLQDLLVTSKTTPRSTEDKTRTTAEILAHWPKNAAPLKYFIGAQKAWLFVIDTRGKVKAYDLLGPKKTARQLVAEVRTFLNNMEGQAKKMHDRVVGVKTYDHGWQDELHGFYQTLLPKGWVLPNSWGRE